jgi:hypothetical protein
VSDIAENNISSTKPNEMILFFNTFPLLSFTSILIFFLQLRK